MFSWNELAGDYAIEMAAAATLAVLVVLRFRVRRRKQRRSPIAVTTSVLRNGMTWAYAVPIDPRTVPPPTPQGRSDWQHYFWSDIVRELGGAPQGSLWLSFLVKTKGPETVVVREAAVSIVSRRAAQMSFGLVDHGGGGGVEDVVHLALNLDDQTPTPWLAYIPSGGVIPVATRNTLGAGKLVKVAPEEPVVINLYVQSQSPGTLTEFYLVLTIEAAGVTKRVSLGLEGAPIRIAGGAELGVPGRTHHWSNGFWVDLT